MIALKVRSRWADVLGGGQSGYEAIARVSLRKKLDKEPSIEELMDYTNELNSYRYSSMAKGLKEDIDRAFRMGDEVYPLDPSPSTADVLLSLDHCSLGHEMCGI